MQIEFQLAEVSRLATPTRDTAMGNQMTTEASENYQDLHQEKDHLVAIVDKNAETLKRISMVASRTTNSVIITDVAGRTEWVNDAFIKLTGYEPCICSCNDFRAYCASAQRDELRRDPDHPDARGPPIALG